MSGPTRRTFLQAMALAPMALPGLARASQQTAPRPPVVDTHLHCFAGKESKDFPYHEKAPYRPEVPATPQHLLKCMSGAGVDYAIVVHPEPYQDDHRYLEHCLEIGKGRLKGTCLFFAGREGTGDRLAALVKKWPIVAVRIHAYAPERLPPFGKPELKQLWQSASDLGLAVQLHLEPRYAPELESLIKDFAKTPVIVDHLGRPFQGTPREHEVIVRWSRYKNTVMKVSAIPNPRDYPHRDIAPIIKQLTEAFGADRMIYGGGFGADATPESYRKARERAHSYLAHLSEEDQAKILGITAVKLFKLGN